MDWSERASEQVSTGAREHCCKNEWGSYVIKRVNRWVNGQAPYALFSRDFYPFWARSINPSFACCFTRSFSCSFTRSNCQLNEPGWSRQMSDASPPCQLSFITPPRPPPTINRSSQKQAFLRTISFRISARALLELKNQSVILPSNKTPPLLFFYCISVM